MTCRSTDSPDCLLSKWSDSRSALPTDSHTSPPPGPTRGGSDKPEPNTADLRVDHHLWGDWTFMRTSMFLTLNWCLASEYVSLALTWQIVECLQYFLLPTNYRNHMHWCDVSGCDVTLITSWLKFYEKFHYLLDSWMFTILPSPN